MKQPSYPVVIPKSWQRERAHFVFRFSMSFVVHMQI